MKIAKKHEEAKICMTSDQWKAVGKMHFSHLLRGFAFAVNFILEPSDTRNCLIAANQLRLLHRSHMAGPGITERVEPRMALCISSDSAGGAMTSDSPVMISVGAAMRPSVGR